jgi:hypothetical protein
MCIMYVCSLIDPEEIHQFTPNLECLCLELLERSKLRERVLSSSTGEGGLCIFGTKLDRRTTPRQSCFYRQGYYRNRGQNPKNLSWVRVSVKIVIYIARKINKTQYQSLKEVGIDLRENVFIWTVICGLLKLVLQNVYV